MSTTELLYWHRYYNENPFGYLRNDYREALNCAVYAAPHCKEEPSITSFLLMQEEEEQDPYEMALKVQQMLGTANRHRRRPVDGGES